MFAKVPIAAGRQIRPDEVFYAIPSQHKQLVANEMSKYSEFQTTTDLLPRNPVMLDNTRRTEKRELVYRAVHRVKQILQESKVVVPSQIDLEISHHYGLENFDRFGSTIITVVNREYCKRLIVLLSGQEHPEQYHNYKDETYHILHGQINLWIDGKQRECKTNDVIIIPKGVRHRFTTASGVVIEEISSSYSQGDSHYTDATIEKTPNRKTLVTYWMD